MNTNNPPNEAPVITVFGSSAPRDGDPAYTLARDLGAAIARAGWTVCNGGYAGTMEAASRGAKSAGGTTVGVTCAFFDTRPNAYTDEEIVAPKLSDRIDILVERADAFVVLPGGTGTLAELGVACELVSKRFGRPRPIVLMTDFWLPVVEIAHREKGRLRQQVFVAQTADDAVNHLRQRL